jgi:hypothetical protein
MPPEELLRLAHDLMPALAALQLVRKEILAGPHAELGPLLDGAIDKVRVTLEALGGG